MNLSTDLNHSIVSKKNIPLRFWFIGDHGVGKSSFIYKFVLESIPKRIQPTIGLENCKKIFQNYELSMWDTAGIEKFRANINITKQIRLADVVFLCFDVKEISTLYNIKDYFYKEVQANVSNNKTKILLGMKCENVETNFYEEIREFVNKENLFYAETSVYYDDNNVYKMFCLENPNDDHKVNLSDKKLNNEDRNFFLRAGVNVIIDLAVSLVANSQIRNTTGEFLTTMNYAKTVTISDSEVRYSYCRCMK